MDGTHAKRMSVTGSQAQRPRPDARRSATTPAINTSQQRYPIRIVGPRASDWLDQWVMAANAVEQ